MPYGLYISAEGAHAQSRRLEALSNNLANVDTPGFKRDLALFQARYAEATQRGDDYPGSKSANDVGGGVLVRQTSTDFSPGTLKRTGIDTDLALDGDAFFVVRKGDDQYLTKAGNFMLDAAGQLTTPEGHAVLSDAGTPMAVDPSLGPWHISEDGGLWQQGTVTYLALVRPQSLGDLAKAGENLFSPLTSPTPLAREERHVRSGYLELSGVRPTVEMMELIEASRAFEANTTMIRNQDQMIGTLVGRLLRSGQ